MHPRKERVSTTRRLVLHARAGRPTHRRLQRCANVARRRGAGAVHLVADGRLRRRSLVCRPARGQHEAGDLPLSAVPRAVAGAGGAPACPSRGRSGPAPPRAHVLRDARTACRAPAAARGGRAAPTRMAVAAPATRDGMSSGGLIGRCRSGRASAALRRPPSGACTGAFRRRRSPVVFR